jgi:hypothetical protein
MAVDCKVYLPPSALIQDVADVLGALAGCKVSSHVITSSVPSRASFFVTDVADVHGMSSGLAECANVTVGTGTRRFHTVWLWEPDSPPFPGARCLITRPTAYAIALFRPLVSFFGGNLIYSDSSDIVNFSQPFRSYDSSNDAEFSALQAAKLAVRPITDADIAAMRPFAARQ